MRERRSTRDAVEIDDDGLRVFAAHFKMADRAVSAPVTSKSP
jgi:hypothetical protein